MRLRITYHADNADTGKPWQLTPGANMRCSAVRKVVSLRKW